MDKITKSLTNLVTYLQKNDFMGWDCFDGLNSKLFQVTPLRHNRFFRMAVTQLVKKSPINLRRLLLIDKGYNPKGLGLFLSGFLQLYKINKDKQFLNHILHFTSLLKELKSQGWMGYCWGYNFDWQNREFFQPKYTPTIVATYFVAKAFIETYEVLGHQEYLDIARSSCDFILKDLNRTGNKDNFCFSYSPLDKSQVYNATLLASNLLSRVYSYFKEDVLIETARNTIKYCIENQNEDGSWYYGAAQNQKWIDSFHTGYNLMSIYDYMTIAKDNCFTEPLLKGLRYYKNNFFLDDFTPKYYNNKIYPIDIHSPAQSVITFIQLNDICEFNTHDFSKNLLEWTIDHMQDKKYGYFYYQINKYYTSKIPYMRWSQAWMFYAMVKFLTTNNNKIKLDFKLE